MLNNLNKNVYNMQVASMSVLVRKIFVISVIGLILTAIAIELLPEDEAKIFVLPILITATLLLGISQIPILKIY